MHAACEAYTLGGGEGGKKNAHHIEPTEERAAAVRVVNRTPDVDCAAVSELCIQ